MSASVNVVPTNRVAQVIGNFRLISAATTNATVVKAGPGSITLIVASNLNAAVRYLKLYDKATAPTVGTDVPFMVISLPLGGVPVVIALNSGIQFATGISIALTTGITDADTTAVAVSEQAVSIQWV